MRSRIIAILDSFALAAMLIAAPSGCSSQPDEVVVPNAADVPPPATGPGETPDPAKIRRVKIK